ncbi:hypothetical protein EV688_101379 [Chromatocurvus halotolerans]|uniref:Uncharacterized protein n=1 Tax=Chromatocurvus halotolerans TaxID=1132028 RepID=A0A4R2KZD0_9GAMM|nr:hypothetical protein EV688_101379 [Chromatocurvus halotolerans]
MPVSELEKKADIRIRAASTEKRIPSGASFKTVYYLGSLIKAYGEEKESGLQALLVAHGRYDSTSSSTSLDP